ncbi:MAG: damage-inducible protein DinB [Thalassobius sp.]|nr:damage-inducible protein DinB [Thalassovita sp.]
MEEQYELIKQSRNILLEYCMTIFPDDLTMESSSFGRGSIRNLLVHVANVYEFWIGKHGLKKDIKFTLYDSIDSIHEIKRLFSSVDQLTQEYFDYVNSNPGIEIIYDINGIKKKTNPITIFTHVITHEFHHKGQILSLSRQLGYKPVDTDIIR